jgi:hypothetical protein
MTAAGNSGNAASRVAEFIYSEGRYVYGGYPDIDDPFLQQARERDVRKREALLHRIQQLTMDRVMFACPSWTTAHSAAWARAWPSRHSTARTWCPIPRGTRCAEVTPL